MEEYVVYVVQFDSTAHGWCDSSEHRTEVAARRELSNFGPDEDQTGYRIIKRTTTEEVL